MSHNKKKNNWFPDGKGKGKRKTADSAAACVGIASAAGIVMMFFLLVVMALVLARIPAPLSILKPTGLVIGSLGAGAAGFVCSRMRREKGFFYGLACGGVLFLVLTIVSFLSWGMKVEPYTFVKLFAMLLCGALGGSVGVNWK